MPHFPVALATLRPSSSRMLAHLGAATLACCATLAVSTAASAGTLRSWTGGTDTDWATGANWNPNGVPVSGDTLTLGASPNIPTSMTISGAVGATSITFANGFNATNTTVIGSGSSTATQKLVLDDGWTLTDNATSGSVTFQQTNGGTKALNIKLGGSGTASVATGGNLVLATVVGDTTNGTGVITKAGAGTLTLSGNNTYSGGTTVTAGTLLVNNTSGSGTGTGAVTVNNSGTLLGGIGSISGAVTVNSGATLSPGGTGGNSVGTLTASGGLTVNGIYQVNLTGTGTPMAGSSYDQTSVGALTLSANSSLKLIAATNTGLAINQVFYVALNANTLGLGGVLNSISGSFSGLNEGAKVTDNLGDTYKISYVANGDNSTLGGNDISLTVTSVTPVPEPTTVAAGLLALGTLGWSQRRRLRAAWPSRCRLVPVV